jgi:hypothetical protein
MTAAELRVYREYRFGPRSVLEPGDRFRVTGGPIYVTDDDRQFPMAERGVFVFHRFCVRGAARWIEAHSETSGGHAILGVGKSVRSRIVPNLRRRPYRVTGKVVGPAPKQIRRSVLKVKSRATK